MALVKAKRGAEGLAVAEAAAAAFPRSLKAWVTLAVLAQRAGNTGRAKAAALHVLELDPNNRNVRAIAGV